MFYYKMYSSYDSERNKKIISQFTWCIIGLFQIISLVKRTLKPSTAIAVFDHIPSNTPFKMPVKELIDVCHEK